MHPRPVWEQVKNVSIDSIVLDKERVRFTPDPCEGEREDPALTF